MYCRNCGYVYREGDRFCRYCGAMLDVPPAPKKGSLWIPFLILAVIGCLGIGLFFALPYSDGPASASSGNSCYYIDNGVLYFDESRYTGGSDLTVPDTLFGQSVLALSEDCFKDCDFLTGIVLPDTLVEIGPGAFRGCTGLRGIKIPETVSQIGTKAFYGCAALEAVAISDTLESIGADAFDECDKLYYIIFDGAYPVWIGLYDEYINPYTTVFCEGGSFFQGKPQDGE